MKANTQYSDLVGTSSADIADITTHHNELNEVAKYFKIDEERFKVVGLSIFGTEDFSVSFICVDKRKSTTEKEHIVSLHIDTEYDNILSLLFKRLNIVLYSKYDKFYSEKDYDEEASLSNYINR